MFKKIALIVMVICLCLSELAGAQSSEKSVHTMNINGTAHVQATPDKAVLVVNVSAYDKNAQVAQSKNAEIASNIARALKGLGITSKDMTTSNYSFQSVYSQEKNKTNQVIGYTSSNSVTITVNDVAQTGRVIDAALKAGASDIGSLEFGLKDTAPFKRQAMELAIADAKEKADIIAKGLGVKVTGINLVRENVGSILSPRKSGINMLDGSNMAKLTAVNMPIEAGEVDLSATVYVEFIMD